MKQNKPLDNAIIDFTKKFSTGIITPKNTMSELKIFFDIVNPIFEQSKSSKDKETIVSGCMAVMTMALNINGIDAPVFSEAFNEMANNLTHRPSDIFQSRPTIPKKIKLNEELKWCLAVILVDQNPQNLTTIINDTANLLKITKSKVKIGLKNRRANRNGGDRYNDPVSLNILKTAEAIIETTPNIKVPSDFYK